jgi:HlyD family secretion protein
MSSTLIRNGTTSHLPPTAALEPPPRRNRRWLLGGAGLVVVLLVLGWLIVGPRLMPKQESLPTVEPAPEPITVTGSVVPVERATLSYSQPGQVVELPFSVGQTVKAGDTLARTEDRELRQRVTDAEAALLVQQAGLARVESLPRSQELAAADAQVEAAQAKLDLLLSGASEADLAEASQALDTAQAQLSSAQAALDQLLAGPTPAERQAATSAVARAQADLQAAEAKLADVEAGPTPETVDMALSAVDADRAAVAAAEASLATFGASTGAEIAVAQASRCASGECGRSRSRRARLRGAEPSRGPGN